MPRPCENQHELQYQKGQVYVPGTCRFCWLVSNRDSYRKLWDGPPTPKPGTELKKLLEWFGLKPSGKCKCNDRVRVMNELGPEKCRINAEMIVGWLEEEAWSRNIPTWRPMLRKLLDTAITNSIAKISNNS